MDLGSPHSFVKIGRGRLASVLKKRPVASHEQGSILVGALALVTIVAVAAALAIRSAQIKIRETRDKEANVQARLALDSAASRILTFLDRALEKNEKIGAAQLAAWCLAQAPISCGPFRVAFTPDTDIIPENKTITLAGMVSTTPAINPHDPLFPDLAMNRDSLRISIMARALQPGYPSFRADYTFRVRTVPVSEWAYFNPGEHRGIVTVDKDPTDSEHQYAHAYVGTCATNLGQLNSPGGVGHIIEARTTTSNDRLWRTVWNGAAGTAKFQNAASAGFTAFHGNPPAGALTDQAWADLKAWGASRTEARDDFDMGLLDQYQAQVHQVAPPAFGSTPAYQMATVSPQNPLRETNVAVLDLAGYLSVHPNNNGNCLIPLPGVPGNCLQTIVVTNAEVLGNPGEPINITFPPTLKTYFAGAVNTNQARLKVEGNIGLISPAIDVLSITNFSGGQRLVHTPYATNELRLTTREAVTLDSVSKTSFVTHREYHELYQELAAWAQGVQRDLLSNPSSPYYVPNIADYNYLLDYLSVYFLNESVAPIISELTDAATNQTELVYTNLTTIYNYAGIGGMGQGNACQPAALATNFYLIHDQLVDQYIPADADFKNPPDFVGTSLEVITNQIAVNQPFARPEIIDLHDRLPSLSEEHTVEARLTAWSPTNLPVSFPLLTPDNLYVLPFAKAYITIHTNYLEDYREETKAWQSTGDQIVVSQLGPELRSVRADELQPLTGLTWRQYLWDTWSAGMTEILEGLGPDTQRYDELGNWNPANVGAWKAMSITVKRDEYSPVELIPRGRPDLQQHDPGFYNDIFVNRNVRFNYQTLGWTMSPEIYTNTAPAFSGRLIVEDGIKTPEGVALGHLLIQGQVTFSHRRKAHPVLGQANVTQFTVQRTPAVIPNNPDRVIDVRISSVVFSRL